MSTGKILAMVGGALAFIAGVVSLATQKPLAYHLLGLVGIEFLPIQGPIVAVLGLIGIAGGLAAIYFANRGEGRMTMYAGAAGLLAPCGLAVLAIAGGYMIQKETGK